MKRISRVLFFVAAASSAVSAFALPPATNVQPIGQQPRLNTPPVFNPNPVPVLTGPPAIAPRDPSFAPVSAPPGSSSEHALLTDPGPQEPVSFSADPAGNMYVGYLDIGGVTKVKKLDRVGNTLWTTPLSVGPSVISVEASYDGVVAVNAGQIVKRLDSSGNVQFTTNLGQSATNGALTVYDNAGGVYVGFLPYPVTGHFIKRVDRYGRIVVSVGPLGAGNVNEFKLVGDASGNVIAVTGGDQVVAQKYSPLGAPIWTAPVTAVYGLKSHVVAQPDGAGGVLVGWSDARRRPLALDLYVQSIDGFGHARWIANGISILNDGFGFDNAGLVSDGAGGAFVSYLAGGQAQIIHLSATGAATWPAPVGITSSKAISLVRDGAGVFAVARQTTDAGPCLWASRIDAAGHMIWADRVKSVGRCTWTPSYYPAVVGGQPVIAYPDNRTGYDDVYLWR